MKQPTTPTPEEQQIVKLNHQYAAGEDASSRTPEECEAYIQSAMQIREEDGIPTTREAMINQLQERNRRREEVE